MGAGTDKLYLFRNSVFFPKLRASRILCDTPGNQNNGLKVYGDYVCLVIFFQPPVNKKFFEFQ